MANEKWTYTHLNLVTPNKDRIFVLPDRDPPRGPVILPCDGPNAAQWHKVGHEEHAHKKWRGHAGTFLAENLGKDISEHAWHIDDFPPNYSLWRKQRQGGGASLAPRYDYYLYGYGQKKRFSSPQEFAFHVVWLFDDEFFKNRDCECTLCTGRKQGEINEIWVGIPSRKIQKDRTLAAQSEDDEMDPSSNDYRIGRREQRKLVRWVKSRRLLLGDQSTSGAPEVAVDPQRDRDLASLRPLRKGELVWVSIPHLMPTYQHSDSPHELVEFWPAVIRDTTPVLTMLSATTKGWRYAIVLLGVNQKFTVDETIIIAWQLYKPSKALRTNLSHPPLPFELTPDLNGVASFFPIPQNDPPSSQSHVPNAPHEIPRNYKNALAALKIAYEIGKLIAEQYYMLDEHQDRGLDGGFREMYQGMWFGPQLVWMDDVVRLELTRLDLETQGINGLLPPSPGATDRCLFARITEFEWDRQRDIPFISARLYELCEEGEYDPDDDIPLLQPSALSAPASAHTEGYPMPLPPPGFKFRRITRNNSEVFLPAVAIASRYESTASLSTPHRLLLSRVMTPQNVTDVLSGAPVGDKYVEAAVRRITSYIGIGNPTWNVIWARRAVEDRHQGVLLAEKDVREHYYQSWKKRQANSRTSAVRGHDSDVEMIVID